MQSEHCRGVCSSQRQLTARWALSERATSSRKVVNRIRTTLGNRATPCARPGCGREYPVRRYRYETLRVIRWRGEASEDIPWVFRRRGGEGTYRPWLFRRRDGHTVKDNLWACAF